MRISIVKRLSILQKIIMICFICIIPENLFPQSNNVTLISRWANGPCKAIAIHGNLAYFGNGGYLEIIDFTNPNKPKEIGKVVMPSLVEGISIMDNYAYVANGREGFYIVNHIGGAEIEDVSANPKSFVINNLSEVRINYNVVSRGKVRINVYNILGQEVTSLVDNIQLAGSYSVDWNGESSGIYFVKVEIGEDIKTYKTMIIR